MRKLKRKNFGFAITCIKRERGKRVIDMGNVEVLNIKDEFIKLGQAIKLAGLVSSGVEAKLVIQDGKVKVDGDTECRRGRKMYDGMTFEYENQTVKIKSSM